MHTQTHTHTQFDAHLFTCGKENKYWYVRLDLMSTIFPFYESAVYDRSLFFANDFIPSLINQHRYQCYGENNVINNTCI